MNPVKRWLTHLTIVAYLGVLGYGIFAHAFKYRVNAHPMMYYIVWDMFCGWAAHESRLHIIAEGESGTYYELSPAPWGEFKPFGEEDRQHYDYLNNATWKMADHVLRHTDHEPMTRIFVVEESWSKKYNLPDGLWAKRFAEEKDPQSYYWTRSIYTPEGVILLNAPTWLGHIGALTVGDNPRLHADSRKGQPFFAVTRSYGSGSGTSGGVMTAIGSPLAGD